MAEQELLDSLERKRCATAKLAEANTALLNEGAEAAAWEALSAAVKSQDREDLKATVEDAVSVSLRDNELSAERNVLAHEERKDAARAELSSAELKRDTGELRDAIQQAEAVGLRADERCTAKQVLAELRVAARDTFTLAIEHRGLGSLKGAIEKGDAAGLASGKGSVAKARLKPEGSSSNGFNDVDEELQTESRCFEATKHKGVEPCSSAAELRWDPEINKAVTFSELTSFDGGELN